MAMSVIQARLLRQRGCQFPIDETDSDAMVPSVRYTVFWKSCVLRFRKLKTCMRSTRLLQQPARQVTLTKPSSFSIA